MLKTSKTAGAVQAKVAHFNIKGLLCKYINRFGMFKPSVHLSHQCLQFLGDQIGSSSQVSTLNTFSSKSLRLDKEAPAAAHSLAAHTINAFAKMPHPIF